MHRSWLATAAGAVVFVLAASAAFAAPEDVRIRVGRAIAPVPLDLAGQTRQEKQQVWLGSYIVNAQGGCNDCHTVPSYTADGDPFMGDPEQINTDRYLCGGRPFGPDLASANITPDENGLPAGLSRAEFFRLLRTGEDPDGGGPLQVMPWPVYGKMTRRDLAAVYAYLSAIPSIPSSACPVEP
jgi:hypothetical protein